MSPLGEDTVVGPRDIEGSPLVLVNDDLGHGLDVWVDLVGEPPDNLLGLTLIPIPRDGPGALELAHDAFDYLTCYRHTINSRGARPS